MSTTKNIAIIGLSIVCVLLAFIILTSGEQESQYFFDSACQAHGYDQMIDGTFNRNIDVEFFVIVCTSTDLTRQDGFIYKYEPLI